MSLLADCPDVQMDTNVRTRGSFERTGRGNRVKEKRTKSQTMRRWKRAGLIRATLMNAGSSEGRMRRMRRGGAGGRDENVTARAGQAESSMIETVGR